MKKNKAFLLLVLFIMALGITFHPTSSAQSPRSTGILKHVSLSLPVHMKAPVANYDLLVMKDTDFHMVPGKPMVPIKVYTFKLPHNAIVEKVEVKVKTAKLTGKYKILPCPQPQPLGLRNQSKLFVEDPRVYSSKKPYPGMFYNYETHKGIDPATLKRTTFVVVRIFPVQYVPATGDVTYVREAEISITYSESTSEPTAKPIVDTVIITNESIFAAAQELALWKNNTGHVAKVYNVSQIIANYPGNDNPEKIRNFINDTVAKYGTIYIILFGDAELVPTRRIDFSNYTIPYMLNPYVECDLYYADLDGTWDTDGDGSYGELEDYVDGYPDVLLGRLPASSISEANVIVDKIKNYSPANSWFRRILLLGTITFQDPLRPDGEILKDYFETNYLPANFSWTKLYEGLGNLTVYNIKAEINKGYGIVNFAGHGYFNCWYLGKEGYFMDYNVYKLTNDYKLPVISTLACLTNDFADTDVAISEAFLVHSNGGAIAYVGAAEIAWAYIGYWVTWGLAGEIDWRFLAAFKQLEDNGTTPTPGLMHTMAISGYLAKHGRSDKLDWLTVVEYGSLLGDPSIPLVGIGDPPPPPPEPKLSGWVVDQHGNPIGGAVVKLYNSTGYLIRENITVNGYYEFKGLSYGTYTINVTAEGYMPCSFDFYYPHCVMTLNITLCSPPPPNTVLVVVDDDAIYYLDQGIWPDEIKNAVEALGFNVLLWNESQLGRPSLKLLTNENVTLVIWHTGTYSYYAVDSIDADTLIEFVKLGGRLLLEGEEIGYNHDNDTFMLYVAHAYYLTDNANAPSVEPVAKHPVVYGLTTIPFASQPPSPDGVAPAENGSEIARYTGIEYSAIVVYDEVPLGGNARVVYIAFPLHYVSSTERTVLIQNAVKWLTSSYYAIASTDKNTYMPGWNATISATIFNGTEPLAGAEVTAKICFPNGSLAAEIALNDLGNGTYIGNYKIPNTAPQGQYSVEIEALISGEIPVHAEAAFNVVASMPHFEFKVTGVLVESAVAEINITVSNNASVIITSVKYWLSGINEVYTAEPVDGVYDESNETVTIVVNASSLEASEYIVNVRAYTDLGADSEEAICCLIVRDLVKRYNLIALTVEPFKALMASDLAKVIGPSLQGVWWWDVEAQEFKGFIPGISPPEDDFPIKTGYGYFVYLTDQAKLVEVKI